MIGMMKHGVLALVLLPVWAAADDAWPSFEVRVGGYITDFESDLRINNSDDIRGTDTDLEDELDLDDGLEELRLDLRWRFAPRHSIDFSYYDISREGRRVIDREISIGDETYAFGTNLNTSLDFQVYKLAYAYSFNQSDNSDTSFSLGLHAIDLGLEVKGALLNLPVDRHTSDVLLPLPVVGFQYTRKLGGPFALSVDADLFAIEYEDYKGSLWDAGITLDIDLTDNIGAYLGYNFVDMSIESEDEDLLGKVEYQYGAVVAGVRVQF